MDAATIAVVWTVGWALVCVSMQSVVRWMGKGNGEERTSAGLLGTLWNTQRGRAGIIMFMFLLWPGMIPAVVFATYDDIRDALKK